MANETDAHSFAFVDFFNLTLGAQTSDGYHYLTDVNIAKADIFFSAIKLFDV